MKPTDPYAEYDLSWRVQMERDIATETVPHEKADPPDCTTERILYATRIWYAERPDGYEVVPAGMITDGASIPRLFLRIFHRDRGRHWRPALMHDHYYGSQPKGMTRAMADRRFRESMRLYGVLAVSRWAMYIGLRIGGWIAWRKNARELQRKL